MEHIRIFNKIIKTEHAKKTQKINDLIRAMQKQ